MMDDWWHLEVANMDVSESALKQSYSISLFQDMLILFQISKFKTFKLDVNRLLRLWRIKLVRIDCLDGDQINLARSVLELKIAFMILLKKLSLKILIPYKFHQVIDILWFCARKKIKVKNYLYVEMLVRVQQGLQVV